MNTDFIHAELLSHHCFINQAFRWMMFDNSVEEEYAPRAKIQRNRLLAVGAPRPPVQHALLCAFSGKVGQEAKHQIVTGVEKTTGMSDNMTEPDEMRCSIKNSEQA